MTTEAKKLYLKIWRVNNKARIKEYENKNRAKRKKYLKQYYAKNKKRYDENRKKWEASNNESITLWKKKYHKTYDPKRYVNDREYLLKTIKLIRQRHRDSIDDVYLKDVLNRLGWRGTRIPKEVMDQKRLSLKIKRKIKQIQNENRKT